jgi:hypothetical protein
MVELSELQMLVLILVTYLVQQEVAETQVVLVASEAMIFLQLHILLHLVDVVTLIFHQTITKGVE